MNAFRKIIQTVLDFIFPRNELVKKLESMSVDALFKEAERADDALFEYRDPLIRTAIWEMKYRGNKKIITLLAKAMRDFVLEEINEGWLFNQREKVLLIPIPLSAKRKRHRGFNQMEEFAKALLKELPEDLFELQSNILRKKVHTQAQTKVKSRKQRLGNLKHVFEVADTSAVSGRTIILLDDVTTTGATLHEAAGTLKASGARRIFPIAIAH